MSRQIASNRIQKPEKGRHHFSRSYFSSLGFLFATLLACTLLLGSGLQARAENRSLSLYNAHTRESATITYKRNGKFDADGLRKLNQFLRDWRRNEKTQMDPALFDLIWQVYKDTGAKKPIHVVSGYRSPATNSMLRETSSGVAKNSRHTMGQAMDFYLPDVSLKSIRNVGLRMQAGGVGYYPSSNSPFVHIDTGNVRHWPRLSRKQLAQVFPNGVTVHVPSDGKPFSGYQIAKAQVDRKKAEMIRDSKSVRRFTQYASAAPEKPAARTQVASANSPSEAQNETLLGRLLNRTPDSPPAPQFAQSDPTPDAEADELLESGSEAQETLLPQQLAALPRSPSAGASAVAEAVDETLQPNEAPAEAAQGEAPGPLTFASLPKKRPDSILAMAARESQDAPAATLETPTNDTGVPKETIQMAALPQARQTFQRKPIEVAQTEIPAQPQPTSSAAEALASMTQNTPASPLPQASPNRFAYAAVDSSFPSLLPEPAPAQKVEAPSRTPLSRTGTSQTGRSDQLDRLTYAYGPTGMGNFAHMKQGTRTATFARLSRPIPGNLKALVHQPAFVVDQQFGTRLDTNLTDTGFSGPAIARMNLRRFN